MISSIVIFGLLSGHLLFDVLVGLLGSRRNIGFGWAFILSAIFTPLIGFLLVLLSDKLPEGSEPKYGCLGYSFGILGAIIMVLVILSILASLLLILFPC
jgi:Na+/melibiose symporter-like transporter